MGNLSPNTWQVLACLIRELQTLMSKTLHHADCKWLLGRYINYIFLVLIITWPVFINSNSSFGGRITGDVSTKYLSWNICATVKEQQAFPFPWITNIHISAFHFCGIGLPFQTKRVVCENFACKIKGLATLKTWHRGQRSWKHFFVS